MVFVSWLKALRRRVADLKLETYVLYLACRDPRTPWYAKALAACVVAYALSPIDLIPDPIPVLGHLDDLIFVPLGLGLARALIPHAVLRDCRRRAAAYTDADAPVRWLGACLIVGLWIAAAILLAWWASGFFKSPDAETGVA